jgi:hypothetical protein
VTGGRNAISARALEKIVRAVVAEEFDVGSNSVGAELIDEGGRLELAIRTPIRVVSIDRLQSEPAAVERMGGTVVGRAERAETTIGERIEELTGSTVSRVALRFTDAEIRRERRVR